MLGFRQQMASVSVLGNQFVEHIAVYPSKADLLFGTLNFLYPVTRNGRIQHHHVVSFCLCLLNVAVLRLCIGGVKHYALALFVGLKRANFIEVLVNRRRRFIHRAAEHVEL